MGSGAFSIGIDEAGYGPALGPLCVGFVRVRGPAGALKGTLRRQALRRVVGDSKRVYQGPARLARLETGVLAALTVVHGRTPESLVELLGAAGADPSGHPWYGDVDVPLPRAADPLDVARASRSLAGGLEARGARLEVAAAGVLLEGQFNRRLLATDNKALVEQELIEELLERHLPDDGDGCVLCDRLGGRQQYEVWLRSRFPLRTIDVLGEARARSAYRMREAARDVRFEFLVGGEGLSAEIALASCIAKYHRELMMGVFNDYWARRLPDVPPTSGYLPDAWRWLEQAAGDELVRSCRDVLVRLR